MSGQDPSPVSAASDVVDDEAELDRPTIAEVRRRDGGECPGCRRIMSVREGAEQGSCNECHRAGWA